MQTTTPAKKIRAKLVDHLDSVLIGEMITERFHGPFVTLSEFEKAIDARTKTRAARVHSPAWYVPSGVSSSRSR